MTAPGRLRVDVLTIFPDVVDAYCEASVLGRARREGIIDVRVQDLRSAARDPHRSVDDAPFGGGAGMVLAPEPVYAAVEQIGPPRPLLLLSPGGRRFDQQMAVEMAALGRFSLLCGRYEGVDQRICDHLVDGEVSVGDFVLAGGELGALVIVEAVCRLLPGVLGNDESSADESFTNGLLEYPQYTRPASFRGWDVPEVLRSGDHARVARWRLAQSLQRTLERRPDLIEARGGISEAERRVMEEFGLRPPSGERSVP
ncbi:MAG TPA: tRNA (guanosine(37)-N1)-methyltransferase TrmD [Acidimicrobiales bacterium]|nr:tRNA (guanosine(37)-N1)-methyltransferase TrmD [Acidimicrobiales bacterium]